MALDEFERERVRYHLGYMNTSTAASLQYGLPRPAQTLFIVEQAMGLLPEVALPRVRRMLQVLDDIECRLVSSQARFAAQSLGDLRIERQQQQEPELLEREYWRWAGRLADQLGVPMYAYSNRFKGQAPTSGMIPVRNG